MLLRLAVLCLIASADLSQSDFTSQQLAQWDRPRAALIRDNIFLDGGVIWNGSLTNGKWGQGPEFYSGPTSLFKLSLNESFDIGGGKPAIFKSVEEGNPSSTWYDGLMIANYDEFYTYGGIASTSRSTRWIASYPLYDIGQVPESDLNRSNDNYAPDPGSFQIKISNGAGANAPSENLGFYFGGLRKDDNTVITITDPNVSLSNSLLIVDTSEQGNAKWTIPGLPEQPDHIRTRAEASLVWIPAGKRGILIAIGGALEPTDVYNGILPWDDPSKEASNNFTTEISVYDISHRAWFTQIVQESEGYPTRLAQACAVVATYFNGSETHHDIYVIGGWDGNNTASINSDVHVLSIPSFQWIELDVSKPGTPRQGHSCFLASPTQIIVIGGTAAGNTQFDTDAVVDVFDIEKLEWTGTYDPTKNDTYKPHSSIRKKVEGAPRPDGMSSNLNEYLDDIYDTTKLKSWSPYTSETPIVSTPTPVPTSEPSNNRKWVTPVAASLGTVGGLALVGLLFFFCFWRPRRRQRALAAKRQSHGTDDTAHRSWIDRWLGGTTAASSTPGKDMGSDTLTETDGAMSPPPAMSENNNNPSELDGYFRGSAYSGRPPLHGGPGPHEIDATGTSVHEVHGRSSAGNIHNQTADIRKYPLYPPSVVSAGHSRSVAGDSLSQPTDNKTDGGSSPTASASPPSRSPVAAPIASIPETAAFRLDGTDSARDTQDLARAGSNRAVSPIRSEGERPQRPGHKRHNSSMSSGLSPLPSPGGPETGNNHGATL